MYKKHIILCLMLLLSIVRVCFSAELKPEIKAIITHYDNGDYDKCLALLQSSQPTNADEKAVVLYFKGVLASGIDLAQQNFQQLINSYPNNKYAQKALIEMGNIYLLERDYDKALGFYNKITDTDLTEKHFWIANTYYEKGDYKSAISSANQFIRLTKSSPHLEDAYYLIAESYINQEQFNNAITTLKKLLTLPKLIEDEQYLRYRYGYAAEMLGNRQEALSQYKQGYEKNRYSQTAHQIEDRLFEMRSRYGSLVNLDFLYPYSAEPLPDIVLAEQLKAEKLLEAEKPDTTSTPAPPVSKESETEFQPGIYLQAGRFGKQENASKLCDKIIKLGLNAQFYKSTQFKDVSWVIIVGPYQTQLDAQNAKDTLRDNNIDTFIIQR